MSLEKLTRALMSCDGCILYSALSDEQDVFAKEFPLALIHPTITLPDDQESDPFAWAEKCVTFFEHRCPFLLIPGTAFDMNGTRRGRGGGWYDRFLSRIPHSWIRIGVADQKQFFKTPIKKQPWDEVVDWVVVRDDDGWDAYYTRGSVHASSIGSR